MHEIKNICWKGICWKDMMKVGQLRQEETSSGYGSRESLAEGLLITNNKHNDVAVIEQLNNNTCTCKKSSSNRKVSSSKGSIISHSSPTLTHEIDNSSKKSYKHSRSSLSGTLENDSLAQVNDNLISQNHELTEQNHALLEELQISRRFFEGTLTDLSAQLSAAESKIKILQETVSTYEESLAQKKAAIHLKDDKPSTPTLEEKPSDTSNNLQKTDNKKIISDEQTITRTTVTVVGVRKCRKTSVSSEQRKQTARSSPPVVSPTIKSESNQDNKKPKMTALQGKNFAKMKEQLLEINQSLKTDIEFLKCRARLPAPTPNPIVTTQTEDVKQPDTNDDGRTEEKENVMKKKKNTDGSPRHTSAKRQQSKEVRKSEKKIKPEYNGTDVDETKGKQPSLISHLPRDGALTLQDHKEKLSEQYHRVTAGTTPEQSPKKEIEKVRRSSSSTRRNSKHLENNSQISPDETKKTSENVT